MSKKELIELEDSELSLLLVQAGGEVFFKVSNRESYVTKDIIFLNHKEIEKLYKLSKKAIKEKRTLRD
jgi:midasin (ATPase involved in ribosome maturation)